MSQVAEDLAAADVIDRDGFAPRIGGKSPVRAALEQVCGLAGPDTGGRSAPGGPWDRYHAAERRVALYREHLGFFAEGWEFQPERTGAEVAAQLRGCAGWVERPATFADIRFPVDLDVGQAIAGSMNWRTSVLSHFLSSARALGLKARSVPANSIVDRHAGLVEVEGTLCVIEVDEANVAFARPVELADLG